MDCQEGKDLMRKTTGHEEEKKTRKKERRFCQKLVRKKQKVPRPKLGVRNKKQRKKEPSKS